MKLNETTATKAEMLIAWDPKAQVFRITYAVDGALETHHITNVENLNLKITDRSGITRQLRLTSAEPVTEDY